MARPSPVELGIPARVPDEEWLARHARSLSARPGALACENTPRSGWRSFVGADTVSAERSHQTAAHAPFMRNRCGGRLVGEDSRLATARRTALSARTPRLKRGRSEEQVHAAPRRRPQRQHDREEDQRKLPLALRGLEPAQQVLGIHLVVRAHCSSSPSIDKKGEVRERRARAGRTAGAQCCAPPPRWSATREGQSRKPGWPRFATLCPPANLAFFVWFSPRTVETLSLKRRRRITLPVHIDRNRVWIVGLLLSIPLIALGAYFGGRA